MKYTKILTSFTMLLLFLGLCSCKNAPEETLPSHKKISIKTFKVKYVQVPILKSFPALTKPKEEVKLSAKISGYIKGIFVNEGQQVKRGDLLLVVDEKGIESQINALKASINAVKEQRDALMARYAYVKANFLRYKSLLAKRAISKEKFDKIKSEYLSLKGQIDALSARIKQIKAQLSETENELKYVKITSPINGWVIKRYVDKGSYVNSGDPLITLYSYEEGLWLVAGIDESLINKVKIGEKVRISIPAFKINENKTISQIIPDIDPLSHTFTVKVSLLNHDIKAGAFGRIYITVSHKKALLIPKDTVIKRGGIDGVYALDKNRILHWRIVRICDCPIRGFCEVLSGLEPGDVIAASDLFKVKEGMRVD